MTHPISWRTMPLSVLPISNQSFDYGWTRTKIKIQSLSKNRSIRSWIVAIPYLSPAITVMWKQPDLVNLRKGWWRRHAENKPASIWTDGQLCGFKALLEIPFYGTTMVSCLIRWQH